MMCTEQQKAERQGDEVTVGAMWESSWLDRRGRQQREKRIHKKEKREKKAVET